MFSFALDQKRESFMFLYIPRKTQLGLIMIDAFTSFVFLPICPLHCNHIFFRKTKPVTTHQHSHVFGWISGRWSTVHLAVLGLKIGISIEFHLKLNSIYWITNGSWFPFGLFAFYLFHQNGDGRTMKRNGQRAPTPISHWIININFIFPIFMWNEMNQV